MGRPDVAEYLEELEGTVDVVDLGIMHGGRVYMWMYRETHTHTRRLWGGGVTDPQRRRWPRRPFSLDAARVRSLFPSPGRPARAGVDQRAEQSQTARTRQGLRSAL